MKIMLFLSFVMIASAQPVVIAGVKCLPGFIGAGQKSTCTVSFVAPDPTGGTMFTIASSTPLASVPGTVASVVGQSVAFDVTAGAAIPASQIASISIVTASSKTTAYVGLTGTPPLTQATLQTVVTAIQTWTNTISKDAGKNGSTIKSDVASLQRWVTILQNDIAAMKRQFDIEALLVGTKTGATLYDDIGICAGNSGCKLLMTGWTCSNAPLWTANTVYDLSTLVSDAAGNMYRLTGVASGVTPISGTTMPVWNAVQGNTTSDGAYTWTDVVAPLCTVGVLPTALLK